MSYVAINQKRYVHYIGHNAYGKGTWTFASNYKKLDEAVSFMTEGTYQEAATAAKEWASANGLNEVYLLERNDLATAVLAEGTTLNSLKAAEHERDGKGEFETHGAAVHFKHHETGLTHKWNFRTPKEAKTNLSMWRKHAEHPEVKE